MALLILDGDAGAGCGGTGVVTSGAVKTYAEGKLVVLDGDVYTCSLHGAQTIIAGTIKTYAEGELICIDGDLSSCGATITSSATKTEAE